MHENMRMELTQLRSQRGQEAHIVECIDNDETASVIATLVRARTLVIMTSVEGIYRDAADPSTLIEEISGGTPEELVENIRTCQKACIGASRPGAGGAYTKLEYIIEPALAGTRVVIGHARHRLSDLAEGRVPCTVVGLK
jgi:glutamate 5-kinase